MRVAWLALSAFGQGLKQQVSHTHLQNGLVGISNELFAQMQGAGTKRQDGAYICTATTAIDMVAHIHEGTFGQDAFSALNKYVGAWVCSSLMECWWNKQSHMLANKQWCMHLHHIHTDLYCKTGRCTRGCNASHASVTSVLWSPDAPAL